MFSDVCKIYRRDEKYLVLNPLVPAWVVTNINGVLLLKLYAEDKPFDDIAAEFSKYAPDVPLSTSVKFLQKAQAENLFDMPQVCVYTPRPLEEICLNITDNYNLRCIFCIVAQRVEDEKHMTLEDYKRVLDEAKEINPEMKIIITGGERRKVSIDTAFKKSADILIMDEPDNNLDTKALDALTKKILDGKEKRITLIISHDERLIKISDEIIDFNLRGI